jgi:hypothetical protein
MQHYLKELQRQPYYSSGKTIAIPRSLQQKLAFDAAAQFEAEQRTIFEKRRAEYDLLEKHGGDLNAGDSNKRVIPPPSLISYTYTVTLAQAGNDTRMTEQYFTLEIGIPGVIWGISLGWDGSGAIEPVPGAEDYYIADPGDVSDSDFTNRIQSIVGTINTYSEGYGYTATFLVGSAGVGSFKITPTNDVVRSSPTASVGTWAVST